MERYTGPFQKGQQFFFAGKSLGLTKLGMNAAILPPNWEHYPEHDHSADNETTARTSNRAMQRAASGCAVERVTPLKKP